jgi:hypothetical protein
MIGLNTVKKKPPQAEPNQSFAAKKERMKAPAFFPSLTSLTCSALR